MKKLVLVFLIIILLSSAATAVESVENAKISQLEVVQEITQEIWSYTPTGANIRINGDNWLAYDSKRKIFYYGNLRNYNVLILKEEEELFIIAHPWYLVDYEISDAIYIVAERYDGKQYERKFWQFDLMGSGPYEVYEPYFTDPINAAFRLKDLAFSYDNKYTIMAFHDTKRDYLDIYNWEAKYPRYPLFDEFEDRYPIRFITLIPNTYSFLAFLVKEDTLETVIMQADYASGEVDYLKMKDFLCVEGYATTAGQVFLQGIHPETGEAIRLTLPELEATGPNPSYLAKVREQYFSKVTSKQLQRTAEDTADYPVYKVSTPEDLFNAIGSNRVIELAAGTYNLSSIKPGRTKYVETRDVYGGFQWVIHNVTNLTIRSEGEEMIELLARPEEAAVLAFYAAENVTLDSIIAGHSTPVGCSGAVLVFSDCTNVTVRNSLLFGCGTYGFTLDMVDTFLFANSAITDCTVGVAQVGRSKNITFDRAILTGNSGGIYVYSTDNVLFKNTQIADNDYVLAITETDNIILQDSVIQGNSDSALPEGVILKNTQVFKKE